jgi:hypothetical protein
MRPRSRECILRSAQSREPRRRLGDLGGKAAGVPLRLARRGTGEEIRGRPVRAPGQAAQGAHHGGFEHGVPLRRRRIRQTAQQRLGEFRRGEAPVRQLFGGVMSLADVHASVGKRDLIGERVRADPLPVDQRDAEGPQALAQHAVGLRATHEEGLAQPRKGFGGGCLFEHQHARPVHPEAHGRDQSGKRRSQHDGVPAAGAESVGFFDGRQPAHQLVVVPGSPRIRGASSASRASISPIR